jgi:hypothetical protein
MSGAHNPLLPLLFVPSLLGKSFQLIFEHLTAHVLIYVFFIKLP